MSSFNKDVLKSLNLYNEKTGYNIAALLLSDENNYSGLDIVVFRNNLNEIKKRFTLNDKSILQQYYDAISIYKDEYIIEKIEDGFREKKELGPFDAFREAIANSDEEQLHVLLAEGARMKADADALLTARRKNV